LLFLRSGGTGGHQTMLCHSCYPRPTITPRLNILPRACPSVLSDRIPHADQAGLQDVQVHADAGQPAEGEDRHSVLAGYRPHDPRNRGQLPVRQGRRDAPGCGHGDPEQSLADPQGPAQPRSVTVTALRTSPSMDFTGYLHNDATVPIR